MKVSALVWVEHDHEHEFMLPKQGQILLGRLDCDVTFSDRTISRRHAEIKAAAGKYTITNLSRVNLVIINENQRLAEGQSAVLNPDDSFRLGPIRIQVKKLDVAAGKLAMRCRNCGNVNDYAPSGQCKFCGRNLSSAETIRLDKDS